MRSVWAAIVAAACAGLAGWSVGCGGVGGASGGNDAPPSEIARIHKARCGSCHLRVEPGERTRAELEAALPRHRSRVHLTEEQWQEMADYLAAPADAGRH